MQFLIEAFGLRVRTKSAEAGAAEAEACRTHHVEIFQAGYLLALNTDISTPK